MMILDISIIIYFSDEHVLFEDRDKEVFMLPIIMK